MLSAPGGRNLFIGHLAGGTPADPSATNNTFVGPSAGSSNETGSGNTYIGTYAGSSSKNGVQNVYIGYSAGGGFTNGGGIANVFVGTGSGQRTNLGGSNTFLGSGAGGTQITGNSNTALGVGAGSGVITADNVIAIGAQGANVDSSCFIGNIRGVTTANTNAIPVVIDSAHQLGTMSSSRRFKNEIQPMDKASEAILALRPVTFHYKSDKAGTPQFGLVAEEVAEVNPDLVVRDDEGEIYTVRYDAVNAMLLNEFLKTHRKMEAQEAMIARQQKQIETLTAGLQKVSAQLELSKPAPHTALNNQ